MTFMILFCITKTGSIIDGYVNPQTDTPYEINGANVHNRAAQVYPEEHSV